MNNTGSNKPSLKRLVPVERKAMSVSQSTLVQEKPLRPEGSLPLLVEPMVEGVDLTAWVGANHEAIARRLIDHGGILFRGFGIDSLERFEGLAKTYSGELLEYTYRSTPRSQVSGNVYSSTEYAADQSIPLHNEMSYSSQWPLKIWFFCMQPAEQMGETPIADSRRVYNAIDPAVRDRFAEKKVMYVRNYGQGLDLPWQNVFQTESREEVEAYCRQADIEFEWKADDGLRTRERCQAVASHPVTGEMVWFNQAHLFHISNLEPHLRQSLLAAFREEDLPRNAYYGDGSPIEESALADIRAAYDREAIVFPWFKGDILMLDNMLVAHGRRPYSGARKVVVAMAEAMTEG